mgnify:CR=1 FL=1
MLFRSSNVTVHVASPLIVLRVGAGGAPPVPLVDQSKVLPPLTQNIGVVPLPEDVDNHAPAPSILSTIGAAFGANVNFEYRRGYPPTINSHAEADFCAQVAAEVCGPAHVLIDPKPSMGAEDFSYFLQEKPGCYVWLGNGPGEGGCTLHNPHYDFNDEAIPFGVAYWVRLVQRWLADA